MKVSIIIPAYNEERRIKKTLSEYSTFFEKIKRKQKINYEILIVINNTKDRTKEIVQNFSKKNKNILYLDFKKGGKGFAITQGFKDALKRNNDFIGFVDADLATTPQAFFDLILELRKNKKIQGVIASRALKDSVAKFSVIRKITHKGFNLVVRIFFLLPYSDTQCGAKLFKREVLEKINVKISLAEWAYDVNLLYLGRKNGFKIKEIPTVWKDKEGSKVKVIKTSIQMFSGVLRLRLIYSPFEKILRPVKFILFWGDKIINRR